MDLSHIESKDLVAALIGLAIGTPSIYLIFKKFLVKSLLSDADLTAVQTYIQLIQQLKDTNDYLVEQNKSLIDKVDLLESEIEFLKEELIGFGLRRTPRFNKPSSNGET